MREPPCATGAVWFLFGITPACAGTTNHQPYHFFHVKDHPRVCGNHRLRGSVPDDDGCVGSPPRVREPPGKKCTDFDAWGITPACAGTTSGLAHQPDTQRDHPRVCGNHTQVIWGRAPDRGSPPRVREPRL